MRRILIATSNPGKLRDFAGAALRHGVEIASIPNFSSLPAVVEDGLTFEANAQKKAEPIADLLREKSLWPTTPDWRSTR